MHLEENSDVRDNLPGILSIPDILEGYTKKAKPGLLFTQAIAQDCVYKELWGMRQCLSIEKKKGLFLLTTKSQFSKLRVCFLYHNPLCVQESMMGPLPITIKDTKQLNKT